MTDYDEATSTFVGHEPCPACGSSNNLARYSDGHAHCFGCGHYEHGDGTTSSNQNAKRKPVNPDLIPVGSPQALIKRGISEETCTKWGYTISDYHGETVQVANYKDMTGTPVAQHIRLRNKDFRWIGDHKAAGLYGQHLWRDGGKRVVVTEGEIDALTVSQLQGNKWPVVSLPNGVQSARKDIQKSFEWLNKFEEIVLLFDNDDPGRDAVQSVSTIRFPPGKLKVAKLPLKDANEMLQAGRGSEVMNAIYEAKVFRPDGIVAGSELWDVLNEHDEDVSFELPFIGLQKITLGLRLGELWTFTAGSGVGKSAIIREIAYHLMTSGTRVGMIMLEENIKRTSRGLIGLAINKPAHMIWNELTPEEKREGFDATLGTDRVFLYDHFGSTEADNIYAKIRFMAAGCDCKVIFLDHLSIVVSGSDEGNERQLIDNIMTELKTLAMDLNVTIVIVSHLKRPGGDTGHEEGARTSLSQLRGSHAIAQLSDFVVGAERDQQGDHKNITTLRVLKNRFTGETGEAGWLNYDPDTGRLNEQLENPFLSPEERAAKDDYDFSGGSDAPF